MATGSVSSVKAYLGARQIKLGKDIQANILQQIMRQEEKQEAQDALEKKSRRWSPPHLGNNVDIYV